MNRTILLVEDDMLMRERNAIRHAVEDSAITIGIHRASDEE